MPDKPEREGLGPEGAEVAEIHEERDEQTISVSPAQQRSLNVFSVSLDRLRSSISSVDVDVDIYHHHIMTFLLIH